jgi:RNA polymerase sigma-70 factor (ECF subfamily)
MNAVATDAFLETSEAVSRYRDMVFGIALTHTRSLSDAEDVFQEVFLAYHRKQPTFDGAERRKAWLITTTLNCSRQVYSSSWSRKVVALHDPALQEAGTNTGEDFRFRIAEQDEIFQALQTLPALYRSVLHLFYFEDMSIAQISAALGIEAGTVKVQLSRGRALMRDKLKGAYFDD